MCASASGCTGRTRRVGASSAMGGQYIEPMRSRALAQAWRHGAAAAADGPVRGVPRLGCAGRCARACVARFAPELPRCRRCGLRTGAAVALCGACLADPPPFDACSVGCDYAFPWDRLIADFKFNARVELAAPLAQRLLDAVRRDGGAAAALGAAGAAGAAAPGRARLQPGLGAGPPRGARPGLPRRCAAAATRPLTRRAPGRAGLRAAR